MKVGQRVRILDGRNLTSFYLEWFDEMDEYVGREAIVVGGIEPLEFVDLDIDNAKWGWDVNWLEPISEEDD